MSTKPKPSNRAVVERVMRRAEAYAAARANLTRCSWTHNDLDPPRKVVAERRRALRRYLREVL